MHCTAVGGGGGVIAVSNSPDLQQLATLFLISTKQKEGLYIVA